MEKTLDYQSSLPSLPVPTLQETCGKYLESLKPLVSSEQYANSELIVSLFERGVGRKLHQKLLERAKNTRNWLEDWWFDVYMKYRGPLPLMNVQGGGTAPLGPRPRVGLQCFTTSHYLHETINIYLDIIRQKRPVDKMQRTLPTDMMQYYNLFCSGRIPGDDKDMIVRYLHCVPNAAGGMDVIAPIKHITVQANGHIYMVNVLNKKGEARTPPELQRDLELIVDMARRDGPGQAVCSLTAAQRPVWKKAYDHLLMLDRQNETSIYLLNSAILSVCLDKRSQKVPI